MSKNKKTLIFLILAAMITATSAVTGIMTKTVQLPIYMVVTGLAIVWCIIYLKKKWLRIPLAAVIFLIFSIVYQFLIPNFFYHDLGTAFSVNFVNYTSSEDISDYSNHIYGYSKVFFEAGEEEYYVYYMRSLDAQSDNDNYIYDSGGNKVFELKGGNHNAMYVSGGYLYYNYGLVTKRYFPITLSGDSGWEVSISAKYAKVNLNELLENKKISEEEFLSVYQSEYAALEASIGDDKVLDSNDGLLIIRNKTEYD